MSTPSLMAKPGTDEHPGAGWEARAASATFFQVWDFITEAGSFQVPSASIEIFSNAPSYSLLPKQCCSFCRATA